MRFVLLLALLIFLSFGTAIREEDGSRENLTKLLEGVTPYTLSEKIKSTHGGETPLELVTIEYFSFVMVESTKQLIIFGFEHPYFKLGGWVMPLIVIYLVGNYISAVIYSVLFLVFVFIMVFEKIKRGLEK